MKSLWKWATKEIEAPYEAVRHEWNQCHVLEDAVNRIDTIWLRDPIVTPWPISIVDVDAELRSKCSRALQAFMASPQEKVIALIGRSACGGAWNQEVSSSCFRASRTLRASLGIPEADVIAELYDRITHDTRKQSVRTRTQEEVDKIIKFWWKLQEWRTWWLQKHDREDTEAEILTNDEVSEVKRAWENCEMWWELSDEQKRKSHLASLYNACLHNKAGWDLVANAILKNKMPQVQDMRSEWGHETSATQHADLIGDFVEKMCIWLSVFARSLVEYWQTAAYKKARQTTGLGPERSRGSQHSWALPAGDAVVQEYM